MVKAYILELKTEGPHYPTHLTSKNSAKYIVNMFRRERLFIDIQIMTAVIN